MTWSTCHWVFPPYLPALGSGCRADPLPVVSVAGSRAQWLRKGLEQVLAEPELTELSTSWHGRVFPVGH